MTRINLLPPEVLKRRRSEKILVIAIGGMIGLIVILFFVYSITSIRVVGAENEYNEVKAKREKLDKQISSYKVYQEQKTDYTQLENIVKEAVKNRILWDRYLRDISFVIPADIWLTEFTGEASGIEVSGGSFTHSSVAEWLIKLSSVKGDEGEEKFFDVWLVNSEKTEEEDQVFIAFTSTAQLFKVTTSKTEDTSKSDTSESKSESSDSGSSTSSNLGTTSLGSSD